MHIFTFFILIFFIITPSYSHAATHKIIESNSLTSESIGEYLKIHYNLSDESSQSARDIYIRSFNIFNKVKNIDQDAFCKDIKINVYLLEDSVINNREIFNFLDWESWDDKDIWGAYYRVNSEGRRDLFLNTSAPKSILAESSFHELFHWYQDMTCKQLLELPAHEFSIEMCENRNYC